MVEKIEPQVNIYTHPRQLERTQNQEGGYSPLRISIAVGMAAATAVGIGNFLFGGDKPDTEKYAGYIVPDVHSAYLCDGATLQNYYPYTVESQEYTNVAAAVSLKDVSDRACVTFPVDEAYSIVNRDNEQWYGFPEANVAEALTNLGLDPNDTEDIVWVPATGGGTGVGTAEISLSVAPTQ